MKKVSICIPAYKHIDLLNRCICSALEQDYPDFEIIITDDSSDDAVMKKVQSYTDKRIRYFKNPQNLGSPENWNECIRKAEGEYIKILHQDDWFADTESLAAFVRLLDENPDVDIAFSACRNVKGDQIDKPRIITPSVARKIAEEPEFLFKGNILRGPSTCIFRNHKDLFFNPDLIWLVDVEFYIRAIKQYKFIYTAQCLINIGINDLQITQDCLNDVSVLIKEKIYLYQQFQIDKKNYSYKRPLLGYLGGTGIISTKQLKKIFPDHMPVQFSMIDFCWIQYYFLKKQIRIKLSKLLLHGK